MAEITLRDSQARILAYDSGKMGISAVPGSGKTWTLSQLAARLILTVDLEPDQEVLIVTFSNSAVDNFSARIGATLREAGLLEGLGYRVRTLHGLAGDIIRGRPELAGLTNDFVILDEVESDTILSDLVDVQTRQHPDFFDSLLAGHLSPRDVERIKKNQLPAAIKSVAIAYIATAKDMRLTVNELGEIVAENPDASTLLRVCQQIYQDYQAALNYRGAVDFNDLIRLAWQCLNADPTLVARLRYRWPYILEDEAQDSSRLQEDILRLLVGEEGNWVRVGDPNQAIYESFTTANPNLLKQFCASADVKAEDLPESGRSAPRIIELANRLNLWVQHNHPNMWVRDALSLPLIEPTKPGDPQPNPPDTPGSVEFVNDRLTPDGELVYLTKAVAAYQKEHPDHTIAVLAFVNKRVSEIAEALKAAKIPVIDSLMNLPQTTRLSAGAVANILTAIFDPVNPKALARTFEVIHRHERDDIDAWKVVQASSALIKGVDRVEEYLYPQDGDWQKPFIELNTTPEQIDRLGRFREVIQRWHAAASLPLNQLVLVISQDLALEPFELATIHKLSLLIRSYERDHPEWYTCDYIKQLVDIARNERNFRNFSESEQGFNPELHKGEVVVATMHRSKGLEWDKVFLTSANAYDYPSGEEGDSFLSEKYFIEGKRNLEAEVLGELRELVNPAPRYKLEGAETLLARSDVVRERLRLLYVGITRARRSLTISWNTGRFNRTGEALAIRALREMEPPDA